MICCPLFEYYVVQIGPQSKLSSPVTAPALASDGEVQLLVATRRNSILAQAEYTNLNPFSLGFAGGCVRRDLDEVFNALFWVVLQCKLVTKISGIDRWRFWRDEQAYLFWRVGFCCGG